MRFPKAAFFSHPTREETAALRSYAFDRLSAIAAILDDTGMILDTNEAWRLFSRLNDGSGGETGIGANYLEVCERASASGSRDAACVAMGLMAILDGERERFDFEYPCDSSTETRWFMLSAAAAPVVNGSGIVLLHVDITARKALEDRLAAQGDVDELTGLPNRRTAVRTLQAELDAVRSIEATVTVMYLDLDGFKAVNDEHGHAVGDRLLVQVASRIRRAVRGDDVLCRFGGDEFVLICPSLRNVEAQLLAARLRDVMTEPFQVDATELCVGASVGVATSDTASTVDVLLHSADLAMYTDKFRPIAERARDVPLPSSSRSMPTPVPTRPGLAADEPAVFEVFSDSASSAKTGCLSLQANRPMLETETERRRLMHNWHNGGSAGWGIWVAMAVMMTIFVVAAAWVIVTLIRHTAPQAPQQVTGPSPFSAAAILDERFARGEIDADEYTRRRDLLRDTVQPDG